MGSRVPRNSKQKPLGSRWEVENKSVGSVSSVSGVLYPSSVTPPLQMCTKVSVLLHYFTLRHCQTTQIK